MGTMLRALKGALRASRLVAKRAPWQVRAAALITLLGPLTATLILLTRYCFEYWQTVSFSFDGFLVVFLLVAIPAGYALGAVPALLAAVLYCALLTAHARLLRPLIRVCVAAICGGIASWLWFCESLCASGVYGVVGALVMAALSAWHPAVDKAALPGGLGRSPPEAASSNAAECSQPWMSGIQLTEGTAQPLSG
jgi:hypothetical protein